MKYINKHEISPLLQQRYEYVKKSVIKQEIWRQKQIDIFYRTGRPIFTPLLIYKKKLFARNTNQPYK
jgi:hypothetical protein